MARLVIWRGSQFDADRLPPHVNAAECVPADEWFAANRTPKPEATPESVETTSKPAPKRKR